MKNVAVQYWNGEAWVPLNEPAKVLCQSCLFIDSYLATHRYFNITLTPELLAEICELGERDYGKEVTVAYDLVGNPIIVCLSIPK